MSTPHRLHRDTWRHTVAIAISGVLASGGLVALLILDRRGADEYASSIVVGMTLVFGIYGPVFLWLTRVAFGRLDGVRLRDSLRRTAEQRRLVRLLFLGGPKSWATMIGVVGIATVVLMAIGGAQLSIWLLAACVLCVVGTWILLVAIFAVEYMRAWANDDSLRFPGDADPTLADFLYLSVQLSTTFSSSDVELVETSARRLATAHSVVAFAYSTVIIAVFASLVISFAA